MKYIIFCVLGGIYLIAKIGEITAFTVQQTMLIAQEGIEKQLQQLLQCGTIIEELSKGIK